MADEAVLHVQVAYAMPQRQWLIELDLPPGSSAEQAIHASGLLQSQPEIDLGTLKIGIFGQLITLQQVLHGGDRVEIYRDLLIDPMQARRTKALKK